MYSNVFSLLLRTLMVGFCLVTFPFQSFGQLPSCSSVCENQWFWAGLGLCTGSNPAYCFCSSDGKTIDAFTACTSPAFGFAASKSTEPTLDEMDINYEQVVHYPIGMAIDPLTTNAEGSIRLVEKDLCLATKGTKQSYSAQITWRLQLVDPTNPKRGHYIIASGQEEGYLHWMPGQELQVVSDISQLSPLKQTGLEWMLGSGAFENHAATAYRIISMLDYTKGIAISKESGQLSVASLFKPSNNMTTEQLTVTPMILNLNYYSLWKIIPPRGGKEQEVLACE